MTNGSTEPTGGSEPVTPIRRMVRCGTVIAAGYRGLSRGSRYLIGGLLKLTVVVYFIFCALILTLRYGILPNVDLYKPNVEKIASRMLGQSVAIGAIAASWHGLQPYLSLTDVVIRDHAGRAALTLPRVAATVEWWSLAVADLRLADLEITGADLNISRERDGKLYVAGIFIDPSKPGGTAGADWILAQRQIVIRQGRVRWNDAQRAAPELILENLDFVLHNRWRRHRFALHATPAATSTSAVDVRADFTHAAFAKNIADPAVWKGELYLDLPHADLAEWKPYLDYPFELSQGNGSVRAWLQFNHANVANFTADVALAHVVAQLQPDLPPLKLLQVNGRVSASETYQPARKLEWLTLGRHGHTVALTNFSLQTEDGVRLPPTTLRETYAVASNKQPSQTRIQVQALDLKPLAALAADLPLSPAQRQLLQDYAPRGQLTNFSAQWHGDWSDFSGYAIKGSFVGLGIDSRSGKPTSVQASGGRQKNPDDAVATPGFDNLSGSIEATDKGGKLQLNSRQLTLDLPTYVIEPVLPFEELTLQTRWEFPDKNNLLLKLDHLDFRQDGVAASFSGTHLLPLHQPKALGSVDLTGKISTFSFKQIGHYLPSATPEKLRHWLLGALREGRATDVALVLKGDLAQFPFRDQPAGNKSKGQFTVTGKIENGTLDYTPGELGHDGKAPEWPLLQQVDGSFRFDRSRMEINGRSAKTSNVALSDVTAVIADLASPEHQLEINGNAVGALQDFVEFTKHSPVDGWIGGFTEDTKASGRAKLALKLHLPLAHLPDAKVSGTLQFNGNDVVLQNLMPPILKTGGQLEFHERGFSLSGIKGEFLGGLVAISGGSQADDTILVKAEGSLSADGLRQTYTAAALQPPLKRVSGSARYLATIRIKEHRPDIVVESDLSGFELDFPAPLHKPRGQAMPLKFELATRHSDDVLTARDEIKVALGSTIAMRYLRQKPVEKDGSWRVVSGGIGVNVPVPEPDSGLLANLSMESLNVDAWRQVMVPSAPSLATATAAAASDEFELDQYIAPTVVAAQAAELTVMGKKLDHVVVGATHQANSWQANIDAAQASGYVTWDESKSGRGLGRVTARLSRLTIPESAATDVSDLLEGQNEATQIPGLDIVAENFQLFGKQFGRLEVIANNARVTDGREWRISKLAIGNPDAEFKAAGKWTTAGGKSVSNLTYALDIIDAGKLLERFGFAQVLRSGKGRMDGEVTWNGLPFSIDIPSLSGQLNLDLQDGQFLKADPGAAKLLGVLSLQSLPRRLTLDFRDVFSQGFAFDGAVGTAVIAKGRVTTDNFKMRSVSATVLMDGSADLAQESQNLHVVVIPEINLGAASVVYGLAINPVIGLGSFLAQLFLREPLMRAFTFEYSITGPWKDPKVVKLDRMHEPQPAVGSASDAKVKPTPGVITK